MIESLKDRKGELSRLIGAAKKKGEPIELLLSEMKSISQQQKSLASEKKAGKVENQKTQNKSETSVDIVAVSQLFKVANSVEEFKCREVNVRKCGEDDAEEWNHYVQSTVGSCLYHRWEFKSLIHQSFGHNTSYFAAFDEHKKICGVLPTVELNSSLFGHFFVSVPFFNYGGPLANNTEIEKQLIDALIQEAKEKEIEHVEIRCAKQRHGLLEKTNKVSMILALPDSKESLWKQIGTKVRAQVKKSDRFELLMRFGKAELLDDFYYVFSQNMRDLGTPVYSKIFFRNLLESALANDFYIGVVYKGSTPVSCCFLMGHKDTLEIPWASTLKSANLMNANMFMYWNILAKAISDGYQFFDFGRSSKDAGTFKFKKQWGAKSQQLYWYYWLANGDDLPELNPNNPKYRLLIWVWKKMPVWLTKLVGPPVVKFLP
jgi:FemAB-related protein (PEP-CTERM system-associated)